MTTPEDHEMYFFVSAARPSKVFPVTKDQRIAESHALAWVGLQAIFRKSQHSCCILKRQALLARMIKHSSKRQGSRWNKGGRGQVKDAGMIGDRALGGVISLV